MENCKYTVIVAEDEELLLNDLVRKIHDTQLNFQVIATAQTGSQAYELANEMSPDLLVTDIKMPVMDGITLLEKVHILNPDIQFIIVSGFSDFEYAQRAIKVQVSDYLLKPINPDQLYEALLNIRNKLEIAQNTYYEIFNPSMARHTSEQIAAVLQEYIACHYCSDINLNLIAKNIGYSPGYLTKIFDQHYQITPAKYIISLRIAKAKNLLMSSPELTIKQVGELVGYPDQSYFSRIFKKQTGISPFEYRENTT